MNTEKRPCTIFYQVAKDQNRFIQSVYYITSKYKLKINILCFSNGITLTNYYYNVFPSKKITKLFIKKITNLNEWLLIKTPQKNESRVSVKKRNTSE